MFFPPQLDCQPETLCVDVWGHMLQTIEQQDRMPRKRCFKITCGQRLTIPDISQSTSSGSVCDCGALVAMSACILSNFSFAATDWGIPAACTKKTKAKPSTQTTRAQIPQIAYVTDTFQRNPASTPLPVAKLLVVE